MSSVQQRNETIVTDDHGLDYADLGTSPTAIETATSLDLEGVTTHDTEVDKVIQEERLKITPQEVRPSPDYSNKRSIQHPIARAAEKTTEKVVEESIINTQSTKIAQEQLAEKTVVPNTIKEGRLRVAKPQQVATIIEVDARKPSEESSRNSRTVSVELEQPTVTAASQVTSLETPDIPIHLLEKLNLRSRPTQSNNPQSNNQLEVSTVREESTFTSQEEPTLLQEYRPSLTVEQAMKLDLSLAKIGTGQKVKPLSFRGHKLSSGTLLDRLITAIADIIKRLEMRFVSFLTRKKLERKPVKVILPKEEEEEGLHLASFSNSLSRSRKKRNRWLERFKIARR